MEKKNRLRLLDTDDPTLNTLLSEPINAGKGEDLAVGNEAVDRI
jgi:hypothetical protein